MNAIKSLRILAVIFTISVLAGCGEEITNLGDTFIPSSNKGTVKEVDRLNNVPSFHTQIRLKPYRSYTFNSSNTNLYKFNSIDVKNLASDPGSTSDECKDIKVTSNEKSSTELGCHSQKLDLKEIVVQNTGSSFLDLDVVLYGEKITKIPAEE